MGETACGGSSHPRGGATTAAATSPPHPWGDDHDRWGPPMGDDHDRWHPTPPTPSWGGAIWTRTIAESPPGVTGVMTEERDERDGVIGVMGCWRVRDGRVESTPVVLRDRVGRDVIDPCLEFPCRVQFSVFVIRFSVPCRGAVAVLACPCRVGGVPAHLGTLQDPRGPGGGPGRPLGVALKSGVKRHTWGPSRTSGVPLQDPRGPGRPVGVALKSGVKRHTWGPSRTPGVPLQDPRGPGGVLGVALKSGVKRHTSQVIWCSHAIRWCAKRCNKMGYP